jgi:NADH:ubiquinone oxidoreductase subunit E
MDSKKDIVICLGSSCFARGNKKNLRLIDSYIKENNLAEKVYFHGTHCCGICEKGPILKVDEQVYEHLSATDINEIFEKINTKPEE